MPFDAAPIRDPSQRKAYPQTVAGRFRRAKTALSSLILGLFHLGPWLRWDRGAGFPDQAVLLDLDRGRGWLPGAVLWPDEVYYLVGLLIAAAIALFGVSALYGRVWCGFTCPQTVWTELFVRIEALLEGDRNARIKLDQTPWTVAKLARKTAKHLLWLILAVVTGASWTFWFVDAPTAARAFMTLTAGPWMWTSLLVIAASTYLLGGLTREKFCVYMCPWARIQTAMGDLSTRSITYDAARGEPRGKARAGGPPMGDCIDCTLCVRVCPTGTDIRAGYSVSCINCGLCADACAPVMRKLGRPAGLIAFAAAAEAEARAEARAERPAPAAPARPAPHIPPRHRLSAKGVISAAAVTGILLLMAGVFALRPSLTVAAQQERSPVAVALADGTVRNGYRLNLSNRTLAPATYVITAEGVDGAGLRNAAEDETRQTLRVEVSADSTQTVRLFITAPGGAGGNRPLHLRIQDADTGEVAMAETVFSLLKH